MRDSIVSLFQIMNLAICIKILSFLYCFSGRSPRRYLMELIQLRGAFGLTIRTILL